MPYDERPRRATPRLPEAGWLPDPARTDLERYWNGRAWTLRTRDRVSKLERVPAAALAMPKERAKTRPWAKRTLGATAALVVVFFIGSYMGVLPPWVPYSDVATPRQPEPPQVEYPVFGSTDLVTYLAASMIQDSKSVDVSYWVRREGLTFDDVVDALREALAQNPYVFALGWSYSPDGVVEPEYPYERTVAENKRALTAAAVEHAMADPSIAGAATTRDKVTAIHDYIARNATYDYTSFDAFNQGFTQSDSELLTQSQEAYGILVAHTAVCAGYAQAFQLLAHTAGLQAVTITGTAQGTTTGRHAWNEVLVDGEWLVVDVTWDDYDDGSDPARTYLMIEPSDPELATRTMDMDWMVDANIANYGM